MTGNTYDYLKYLRDEEYLKFNNPEIPTVLITLRTLKTIEAFDIDANLFDYKEKDKYYEPKIYHGAGDGTV